MVSTRLQLSPTISNPSTPQNSPSTKQQEPPRTPPPIQPISITHLPSLTVQSTLPLIIQEIKQSLHAAEDIWASCYAFEKPSVHGRVRVQEKEDSRGVVSGIELVGRDGVDLKMLSDTSFTLTSPPLSIPPTLILFPDSIPFTLPKGITTFSITNDGNRFIVGGKDGIIRAGEFANGSVSRVKELRGHVGDMTCVEFFPSNEVVLTGSTDMTIRVFSLSDSSNPRTLIGHTRTITSLHIIGTGRTILSTSLDGTIRLWDIGSSKEIGCVRLTMPISAGIIFSPGLEEVGEELEKMRMVVAHTNGTVTILDLASLTTTTKTTPTLISLSTLSPSPLHTIALSQKIGLIAVGAQNGIITIFDIRELLQSSKEGGMQVDNNERPTSQEEGTGGVILARITRGPAAITSLAFSSSSSHSAETSSSSLIIGTADGLPFRLSLAPSAFLPASTSTEAQSQTKRNLSVALLNEFAGGECDSVLLREQAGGEGIVWSGAMDGGLRRYRS